VTDKSSGDLITAAFILTLNQYRLNGRGDLKQLIISSFGKLKQIYPEEKLLAGILLESRRFFVGRHAELIRYYTELNQTEEIFDQIYQGILKEVDLWTILNAKMVPVFKKTIIVGLLFENFINDAEALVKGLFVHKRFQSVSILFKFIKYSGDDDTKTAKETNSGVFLKVWYDYLTEYISNLIEENMQDSDLISKLIKSKKYLNTIVENFLDSDPEIDYKLRDAFQSSISSAQNNTSAQVNSKLLSYIDLFFKSTSTSTLDIEQGKQTLSDIIIIWKSIKSKESFLKCYQRDLSKRLILSTSQSLELETYFINLLESEINPDLLNPLYTMFKDMETSNKLKLEYSQSGEKSSIDFTPLVLNSHSWPVSKSTIALPDDLSQLLMSFQRFYLSNHKNQKLQYSPGQSFMTVQWNVNNNAKKFLEVSTFQGVVLLLFDEFDALKFSEIKQKVKLDSKTLSSILHSLTRGKYKVLTKGSSGLYSVNEGFQSRKETLKIKQVKMRLIKRSADGAEIDDDGNESDGSEDDEFDDHGQRVTIDESLQAFIVRLLKFQIFIKHDELVTRCLEKFIAEREDVKRNIESLIDSEYIRRDGTDGYRYLPA
jgi:cullin-4